MQPGAAGGLICSLPGTLGVVARYTAAPADVFVVSCSHVLAKCGQFGQDFATMVGVYKVVQQPQSCSCDPSANRIGLLQPDFTVMEANGAVTSDVATAKLDPAVVASLVNRQLVEGIAIADFAREDPATWQPGMKTRLLGAMSGQPRCGAIVSADVGNPVSITFAGLGTVQFTGLVHYTAASLPGDSGGAVIDDQNRLLGIHVGGPDSGITGRVFFPLGPWLLQKGMVLA